MIDDVLDALACPHCGAELSRVDTVLGCVANHRFDLARQGYVALLGARSRTDTGDSAQMVAARVAFQTGGHYAPIAADVAGTAAPYAARSGALLVEVGAGTAYYLAAAVEILTEGRNARGLAIDSSVRAARKAAGAHPRIGSVVADAWAPLPVLDDAADVVISVFAPRNPGEFRRILRPAGALVLVTPEPAHLQELIGPFAMLSVDEEKPARLARAMDGFFRLAISRPLRFSLQLGPDQVRNLVLMGPAARHVNQDAFAVALARLPPVTAVTASVTVSVWLPLR